MLLMNLRTLRKLGLVESIDTIRQLRADILEMILDCNEEDDNAEGRDRRGMRVLSGGITRC